MTGEYEAWDDARTEVREPASIDALNAELDAAYRHAAELAVELRRVRGLLTIEHALRDRMAQELAALKLTVMPPW